jgi:WD40 repeat protein
MVRFLFAVAACLGCAWIAPWDLTSGKQPVKQPPPRLDAYGDPLPSQALVRLGTARLRHAPYLYALVFAPDGKTLASGGGDDTIRLWDSATGKEIRRFVGHKREICDLAFSPDSQQLASASWDRTVRIWDLQSGEELRRFDELDASVVAYSPDGKIIATGASKKIVFWDAVAGTKLRTFTELGKDGKDLKTLAFAPDGNAIAIGSEDGIHFLDLVTGKRSLSLTDVATVSVFFGPSGKTLISGHHHKLNSRSSSAGAYEGAVRLWDVDSAKETLNWKWPAGSMPHLALSPDGKQLAAATEDYTIQIWETSTGKTLRRLEKCRDWPFCLAFSPHGKVLAVGGGGPVIHFWDLTTGKELYNAPHLGVPSFVLSPPSRLLATTDGGREVFLWELPTGKPLQVLAAPQGIAFCIGFTPDSQRLLWGSQVYKTKNEDHLTAIHVWSAVKGRQILTWQSPEYMDRVSLSPDGRWLASTGSAIRLWNVETGKEQLAFKGLGSNFSIAFSPDSKILAAAVDTVLRWWDVVSGKEVDSLEMNLDPVNAVNHRGRLSFASASSVLACDLRSAHLFDLPRKDKTFTVNYRKSEFLRDISLFPNGRTLVTSNEMELRFSDMPSNKVVRQLNLMDLPGNRHRFSPDGRSLLVYGKGVCLLEAATGKERHRVDGLAGDVESAHISADGKYLITANSDTTVLLWDLMQSDANNQSGHADSGTPDLLKLWADLKANDAAQAYRAIKLMYAAGGAALAFIKERIPPIVPADSAKIAKLLTDLDNPSFKVRDSATKELEQLGVLAKSALNLALNAKPTLETRRRIESVLQKLPDWMQSSDQLRMLRALECVELIGTPEAREYLRGLSEGAPGVRLTMEAQEALARLNHLAFPNQ